MKRVFLYYPTIDFQDRKWLYQSLLYADAVGTLVPFDGLEDENWQMPDELRYLLDEDEYVPYFVSNLISKYPNQYNGHLQLYKKFINSEEYKKLKTEQKHRLGLEHNRSLLYIGYSGQLRSRLFDSGHVDGSIEVLGEGQINPYEPQSDETNFQKMLARAETREKNATAIVIERVAALHYLFTLTQFVANIDENLVIPCTNDAFYESIAFSTAVPTRSGLRLLLDQCIPVPDVNTPLKNIVDFKKKRKPELLRLRKKVSELQDEITKAASPQETKEILLLFRESIAIELSTVRRVLLESKISFISDSMSSLLKLSNPVLFSALLASGIISAQLNPILGLGIGGIGVAGELLTKYMLGNHNHETSELSYLIAAYKKGLINYD